MKEQPLNKTILASLQNTFGTKDQWQISSLKRYSGAQVFIADNGSKKYVVKLFAQKDEHHRIMRIQKIAALAGYGPKVYYDNPDQGLLIMDFLQQEPCSPETLYKDLAMLCKKIHQGPSFGDNGQLWERTRGHLAKLQQLDQSIVDFNEVSNYLENIVNQVKDGLTKVPCHRDLHPNNLIYAHNQFFAIDLDLAGDDDPYIDLAKVALFYCMNEDSAVDLFLTHYFGHTPTEHEKNKFIHMKKISFLVSAVEFLNIAPKDLWHQKPELENYAGYLQKIWQGQVSLGSPKEHLKFGLILLEEAMKPIYFNNQ